MALATHRRSFTPSTGFLSFQNHDDDEEVVDRPRSFSGSLPQYLVDGASIEQLADNRAGKSFLLVPSPTISHKKPTEVRNDYPSSSPTILRSKFTNHHRQPPRRRQRPTEITPAKTEEEITEPITPLPESASSDILSVIPEPPKIQYCVVCSENFTTPEIVVRAAGGCTHRSRTCGDCSSSWIASQLEIMGWENVRCPECPRLLSYDDIKSSASEQVFQRYVFMIYYHVKY
jgi:hypothetical protein